MQYTAVAPNSKLEPLVECYWIVEGDEQAEQKIIPDGYPELIFHFRDPYHLLENSRWKIQPLCIAAGQLQKPIYVKPTGASGVVGIKFKPTGLWKLLGCNMQALTNQTLGCVEISNSAANSIIMELRNADDNTSRVAVIEKFLLEKFNDPIPISELDSVILHILLSRGQIKLDALSNQFGLGLRKMERLFKLQVGLPAKLYARLIRFTSVFKLLQQPSLSKSEITYLAGYFDQPHFNREFKEFTGENPEKYFQQNHAFANFFMSR